MRGRTHLAIGDDEAGLRVARDEGDALVDAGVELVEAGQDVGQIDERAAALVDLVEDKVAEELCASVLGAGLSSTEE
jgi:hypothetical protein